MGKASSIMYLIIHKPLLPKIIIITTMTTTTKKPSKKKTPYKAFYMVGVATK